MLNQKTNDFFFFLSSTKSLAFNNEGDSDAQICPY